MFGVDEQEVAMNKITSSIIYLMVVRSKIVFHKKSILFRK